MTAHTASAHAGNGGGSVFFVVVALLVIAGGILRAVRPDIGWRMSRWQYRNKTALEPSNAGLVAARITGVVVAVVGVVILVIGTNH